MDEEKRIDLLLDLMRRPIPWDPIPPWLRLDEKMQRQFAKLELEFQMKELELQQQKLKEVAKLTGVG